MAEKGNIAAMRVALKKARLFAGCATQDRVIVGMGCIDRDKLCDEIDAALAKPARNCDVGTPEEQLDRYGLFCQNRCPICENRHACHICGERYRMKCMSAWAQAKYEAEGGAEC